MDTYKVFTSYENGKVPHHQLYDLLRDRDININCEVEEGRLSALKNAVKWSKSGHSRVTY